MEQKHIPQKRLGQNFLTSEGAIHRTIEAGEIMPGMRVIEIGPGKGALTRALLNRGARVSAIEKDSKLVAELQESFGQELEEGALTLLEGDATLAPLGTLADVEPYRIVANIPYNITGLLLRHIFSQSHLPERVVLIVQKEVAERIARSKKESILSLSVKAYGTPRYITTIKAGSFYPKPKVDSALLAISSISRDAFSSRGEEELFFTLIKQGFAQKRKMLKRRLLEIESVDTNSLEKSYGICEIPLKARAEDLSLDDWLCLVRHA